MTFGELRWRGRVTFLLLGALSVVGHSADAAPVKTQPAKATVTPGAKSDPKSKHGMPPAAPDYGMPPVKLINQQVRQGWEASQLLPSPSATDSEWCRRLFLDLLGRVPTIDELGKFAGNKSANRRVELVNSLLGEDYVEDYAKNWTILWTNILIGRTGGTGKKAVISRPGLQFALKRAFQKNMPYDRLVSELVSAQGMSKRGETGFNGFVNFLSNT